MPTPARKKATIPSHPLYTIYVVSESADSHRPVLVAQNGKVPLNEPVTRASKAEDVAHNLIAAAGTGRIAVVRITLNEFKRKFPRFAPNAGRKK